MLIARISIGLLVAGLAAACSESTVPVRESIAGIHAEWAPGERTAVGGIGDSIRVTAYPTSASGLRIDTLVPITFLSRRPDIAKVQQNGEVTLVGMGDTYILASLSSGARTYVDSVHIVGANITLAAMLANARLCGEAEIPRNRLGVGCHS